MENELYHHGKKGMKWGVRLYQNKDGSLTELGKRRYYKEADKAGYKEEGYSGRRYKTTKKGKVQTFDADSDKWVKDDLTRSRKLANEASGMTNELKKANSVFRKEQPRVRMDLSNMSDKEMREKINRELLERQYNDVFNPKKVSKGKERVDRTLEVAGTVLGVTSSALGIALAIKELT